MPNDGLPAWGSGGVTFVNKFTVHAAPEEFERVFAETSAFMAEQDGFITHTLMRHVEEPGSYVNVAQWRDADSFRWAVGVPRFRPHAEALRKLSTSEPNLYVPLKTVTATEREPS